MNPTATKKILVVDDEPEICWIVKKVLVEAGFEVDLAFDGERGLDMVERGEPNLVLLDLRLPGIDGLETLKRIKAQHTQLPVVILSAFDNVGAAVRAMKLGAYDYISKPLNVDEMLITLKNALQTTALINEVGQLREQIAQTQTENLIWSCPAMNKVLEMVGRIARYDVTALVQGDSGTGKELIAQYIHAHSARSQGPFVSIDCGALPESLVESELFGYERGAFTGAQERKLGRFELAQNGTLFLDEIGNLSLNIQVKLLRVLQERKLQRLGGKGEIDINVRIITATNTVLDKALRDGTFREDLYHRLNEFTVALPSLKERVEDIPVLAQHFLARYNRQFSKTVEGFSPEVMEIFRQYAWPGNVRELMHAVKRAVVLAAEKIETLHLPPEILEWQPRPQSVAVALTPSPETAMRPLKEICQEVSRKVERETIIRVLQETRWNKVKTARLLKINYKTLFNKMKELGI
ncbi:MAG: sigma-54-dependent Fis family transcriptional regulator [Candidatus Firestonebacteria bacterium]|nr:sigma-54-dependent Fis family transcriptional regulator [Candidatus Firestonebacteria bacterium]